MRFLFRKINVQCYDMPKSMRRGVRAGNAMNPYVQLPLRRLLLLLMTKNENIRFRGIHSDETGVNKTPSSACSELRVIE